MRQKNSLGLGVDTLIPTAGDTTTASGSGLATVTTFDLWGHTDSSNTSPIYRMTKVGINNNNPSYQLDINGTLHAVGLVQFDNTLTVEEHTELKATLKVTGISTFVGITTQESTIFTNQLNSVGLSTFNLSLIHI